MATLITKIQEGLFSFDINGTVYAGSYVNVYVKGENLFFNVGTSELCENFNDVEYDNGTETVGFASAIECLIALKDAGFTGNFNGGGSAPKQGAYQFYHDGTDYQLVKIGNGLGYDLSYTKTGVGTYEITGFTDNLSGGRGYVYCPDSVAFVSSGSLTKSIELAFNTEDGVLTIFTLDTSTLLPSDLVLPTATLLFTVIL